MSRIKEFEKELREERVKTAESINSLGNEEELNGYGTELKELYIEGKISEEEWNERLENYLRKKYNIN